MLTHSMQWTQRSSFSIGSGGSSADVSTEPKRTLGPYFGVSSILFTPKVPRPARSAACR